ncbi:ATP-binding protein [Vibrio breoganii]|uniref:AAA+ ATPase domain-containing protein n=1 Tax=Vibrio breoganii TaxID=553239 RepID=A0AAP8MVT6_9VIBR|nr:ATP-binding protein [Vibrio breoganii]PMP10245.1 hypothetical protein BCS93_11255 [Vibrio breoganii]
MEQVAKKLGFMQRLKRHVKNPISREEIDQLRILDEQRFAQEITERQHHLRMERLIGRSAILPAYLNCSLDNFTISCEEQAQVKRMAEFYIQTFGQNPQNFVFSGGTGTGKNHLASAISLALIREGYSVVLISVPELMIQLRACYDKNNNRTEQEFFEQLLKLDLLIIDEVGVMRGTTNELISLNHIVDARQSNLKATGMLTNLNVQEFSKILGDRITDRMRTGTWHSFNWHSYR